MANLWRRCNWRVGEGIDGKIDLDRNNNNNNDNNKRCWVQNPFQGRDKIWKILWKGQSKNDVTHSEHIKSPVKFIITDNPNQSRLFRQKQQFFIIAVWYHRSLDSRITLNRHTAFFWPSSLKSIQLWRWCKIRLGV